MHTHTPRAQQHRQVQSLAAVSYTHLDVYKRQVREGVGDNTVLAMGDCAINIDPTEDELVEIGLECAKCAKTFGIDPKVAYLLSLIHISPPSSTIWCATAWSSPPAPCGTTIRRS